MMPTAPSCAAAPASAARLTQIPAVRNAAVIAIGYGLVFLAAGTLVALTGAIAVQREPK